MDVRLKNLLLRIREILAEENRHPKNTKIVMGSYLVNLISSDLKCGTISPHSYFHFGITLFGYPVEVDYLNNLNLEIVSNTYIDAEKILNFGVETPSER